MTAFWRPEGEKAGGLTSMVSLRRGELDRGWPCSGVSVGTPSPGVRSISDWLETCAEAAPLAEVPEGTVSNR